MRKQIWRTLLSKLGWSSRHMPLFRDAVKEHAIKWGKQIKFKKSDRRQVRALPGCPWEIYCSYVENDAIYRVKTFTEPHECTRSFNVPWVSTKWIINKYSERIRKNPTWPIPSLVATIEGEKNVRVNPQKAYRARKKSLAMIEGSAAEQFTWLNGYAQEILNTNAGTTLIIKVKQVGQSDTEVRKPANTAAPSLRKPASTASPSVSNAGPSLGTTVNAPIPTRFQIPVCKRTSVSLQLGDEIPEGILALLLSRLQRRWLLPSKNSLHFGYSFGSSSVASITASSGKYVCIGS
ncbi:hypothetical protein RHGRI_011387 [Rhododendron griersonianum]|uniref:Transposase MuDR plant domain-containing protein n=1 Tax=Rhododendron griersonianum TaxID=479676 RepID=A0AAV6KMM9_9ERIC|nr:hypothetical protein RHGRI_011387 [Rhododendron griersonianum]